MHREACAYSDLARRCNPRGVAVSD